MNNPNVIRIASLNYLGDLHCLLCNEGESSYHQLMFDHCTEIMNLRTRDRIDDSKSNRDLLTQVLKAHNFGTVVFDREL